LLKITDVRDILPGEILVLRCNNGCSSSQGPAQGHVALIDAPAMEKEATLPLLEGTLQWTVAIIDANDYPHDLHDTRRQTDGRKVTGVGRGTLRLYTNANGVVVGYTEGPNGHRFHAIEQRPIVFGRPK
jgi:hypothetical protein